MPFKQWHGTLYDQKIKIGIRREYSQSNSTKNTNAQLIMTIHHSMFFFNGCNFVALVPFIFSHFSKFCYI